MDNVRYSLPIVARTTPANLDVFGQSSMEGIIQQAIPEGNSNDRPEESEQVIDLDHVPVGYFNELRGSSPPALPGLCRVT